MSLMEGMKFLSINKTIKNMKVSIPSEPLVVIQTESGPLNINFRPKTRHVVSIERQFKGQGDVERALRLLALLVSESMGISVTEAYNSLMEVDLKDLTPALELLS